MATIKKKGAKPQFEHDCSDCVFLGREEKNGTIYDLWIHVNPEYFSVIHRKSSEPADYACYIMARAG